MSSLLYSKVDPNVFWTCRHTLEHLCNILPLSEGECYTPLDSVRFISGKLIVTDPSTRAVKIMRDIIDSEFSFIETTQPLSTPTWKRTFPRIRSIAATAIHSGVSADIDRIEYRYVDTEVGYVCFCDDLWFGSSRAYRESYFQGNGGPRENVPLYPQDGVSKDCCGYAYPCLSQFGTAMLTLYYIKDRVCSFVLRIGASDDEIWSFRSLYRTQEGE